MEPVCWLGIVVIGGIGAALYGMLTKGSSCDCHSKKDSPVVKESTEVKESSSSSSGVDERKEKAIDDLIK